MSLVADTAASTPVAFERGGPGYSSLTLRSGEVVAIDGGDIFLRDDQDADTYRVSPTAAEMRAIAAELIRHAEIKEEKEIGA